MARYIERIQIHDLFHLHNLTIPVGDEQHPHLLITGKNGSGKTVLLNAIAEFLEAIKSDKDFRFLQYKDLFQQDMENSKRAKDQVQRVQARNRANSWADKVYKLYGKVEVSLSDAEQLVERYCQDQFIIVYHNAHRKLQVEVPKSIKVPTITKKTDITSTNTKQLLYFLTHNKIQELLAKGENNSDIYLSASQWFSSFEDLLREIFDDQELRLEFNQSNYQFLIVSGNKRFDFNQLSDGYAALIEIVADLILRMQGTNASRPDYSTKGIVLIDEIEAHLHIALQKQALPLLTRLFPNIQFIVSTHSPFVLSSLPNATAFDLEHQKAVSDLTDYSFSALAEGYFGVANESGYAQVQLQRMRALLAQPTLSEAEANELRLLKEEFEKMSEMAAPQTVAQYRQLYLQNSEKLKALGL